MTRLTRVSLAAALTTFGSVIASAGEPKVDVEWRSCMSVSTVVSSKNACYVVSLQTLEKKYQIQLCAGVNVNGGTIVLGGGASTLMCATVDVPAGGDKKAAKRQAEQALKEKLNDPKTQESLKAALGYSGPIRGVGAVKLTEDADKADELKKLLKELDRVKRLRP